MAEDVPATRGVAPRLVGIPARDVPLFVVLRRGPSRWWQVLLWHTDTDQVERGQWVHHRIIAELCDVSPDGKLMVYGAVDGRRRNKHEKWVAVARTGYFSALHMWAVAGPGYGGGFFAENRELSLCGGLGDAKTL